MRAILPRDTDRRKAHAGHVAGSYPGRRAPARRRVRQLGPGPSATPRGGRPGREVGDPVLDAPEELPAGEPPGLCDLLDGSGCHVALPGLAQEPGDERRIEARLPCDGCDLSPSLDLGQPLEPESEPLADHIG